jgi:hypothetical protein
VAVVVELERLEVGLVMLVVMVARNTAEKVVLVVT